jgi:hypothetical protein
VKPGSATAEVMRVLWAFRREHGWRPGAGLVWNPEGDGTERAKCPFCGRKPHGAYVPAGKQTYRP